MLVPILQPLNHERADLAVGKGGAALLDARTAACDEQLAIDLDAVRPLRRCRRLAKFLRRLGLLPQTERVLVIALLSTPP
eukprot:6654531-Prymnesium_polylepis.1